MNINPSKNHILHGILTTKCIVNSIIPLKFSQVELNLPSFSFAYYLEGTNQKGATKNT